MARDSSVIFRALSDPEGLDRATRDAFARRYAARAFELGLAYLGADGSSPIPAAFPPLFEPRAETVARSRLARVLTAALASTARAAWGGALGAPVRDALVAELDPVEREIVLATYKTVRDLATVRVDMFAGEDGLDHVLEINATIPAMQGYSDAAARAAVEAALVELGGRSESAAELEADRLLTPLGSNGDDLLASLLSCYRARGGTAPRPSIALVHRPGDSQLAELSRLARGFRRRGFAARTATTTEIGLDGGRMLAGDQPVDLLYRHVFARKVPPGSDLMRILSDPSRFMIFNPVDPHLEQKSLLAELSAAAAEPERAAAAGLSAEISALVGRHLPWTRRLAPGPATLQDGRRIPDLVEHVRTDRAHLVLKKSWDFGGKSVFLGAEHGDAASLARSRTRFGSELSWGALVEACAEEGGFVVQERIRSTARPLLIAGPGGARETEAFVDVSAYTGLGAGDAHGGVCRASGSPIVNIQSGGGVLPLLPASLLGSAPP